MNKATGSRGRRRSSSSFSRTAATYRPPEVDPQRPRSRRRRSRHERLLKARLMALAFGLAVFGVAAGLLTLLAGEMGDGDEEEATASSPVPAPPRSDKPDAVVAVVTCPRADKRVQHPAYAAACGDSATLKGLLARSGAGDTPDPRPEFAGRTALHHAAQRGDTTMVEQLLAAGANPNQADAAGDTPLHLVASTPQLREPEFVARRLLDGGARLDLTNQRGRTPIQELESHHKLLLHHQDLAMVLFRAERENHLSQWLTPTVPRGQRPLDLPQPETPEETVVEVETALGRVRLPVDPPGAGPVDP